jgi:hypothetical protein
MNKGDIKMTLEKLTMLLGQLGTSLLVLAVCIPTLFCLGVCLWVWLFR